MELQSSVSETVFASIIRVEVMMAYRVIIQHSGDSPCLDHHINPDDGGRDSLQNIGL
jgi:hypothetical protein